MRAQRRVAQTGGVVEQIADAIAARDSQDSTRSDSPLLKTDDAITIDTSNRSIDQVLDQIVALLPQQS